MDNNTFVQEFGGSDAPALMKQTLKHLDIPNDVTRIRIEIESESPFSWNGEVSENGSNPEAEAEEQTVEERIEVPGENGNEIRAENLHNFQSESDAYKIAKFLTSKEQFLKTREIRQMMPDDWTVNENSISQNLWSLCQSGVVERKGDTRYEYKITGKGKASIDAVSG